VLFDHEHEILWNGIDAAKEADSIGIDVNNAYSYEASEAGIITMYNMVCDAALERRQEKK